MAILERHFMIHNPNGIHCRVAKRLARAAMDASSEVRLFGNGLEADGRSILEILSLASTRGARITVRVEGDDADQAMAALGRVLESRED